MEPGKEWETTRQREREQEEETRQRQGREECSLMETARADGGVREMQCLLD